MCDLIFGDFAIYTFLCHGNVLGREREVLSFRLWLLDKKWKDAVSWEDGLGSSFRDTVEWVPKGKKTHLKDFKKDYILPWMYKLPGTKKARSGSTYLIDF